MREDKRKRGKGRKRGGSASMKYWQIFWDRPY